MKIQLKKIQPFIILFLILKPFCIFSQITISKFEKEKEQIVEKSVPYDSLANWESLPKLSGYKKFIGQRVYLPLKKNKYQNIAPQTYDPYMEIKDFHPFLFKRNSETIVLDSTNTKKGLSKTFAFRDVGPDYHKTLIIDSVKTNIYKPYLYYGYFNNYNIAYDFRFTTNDVFGNKYFMITDVLYGDKLKEMNFSTNYYYSFESNQKKSKKDTKSNEILSKSINIKGSEIAFELKDEVTGEILYYWEDGNSYWENRLILVSYFIKQKEKYVGENLLADFGTMEFQDLKKMTTIEDNNGKSITIPKIVKIEPNSLWNCTDVTIIEGTSWISYILKNQKDETVAINEIRYWILEKDILEKEKQKKITQQNLKLKQEIEFKDLEIKEKIAFEKRKKECIEKFGNANGELIALGKLKIGMSKEMCKKSWGIPIWSNKTTNENGTIERWYYGFDYSLFFVGNELKQIEQ